LIKLGTNRGGNRKQTTLEKEEKHVKLRENLSICAVKIKGRKVFNNARTHGKSSPSKQKKGVGVCPGREKGEFEKNMGPEEGRPSKVA